MIVPGVIPASFRTASHRPVMAVGVDRLGYELVERVGVLLPMLLMQQDVVIHSIRVPVVEVYRLLAGFFRHTDPSPFEGDLVEVEPVLLGAMDDCIFEGDVVIPLEVHAVRVHQDGVRRWPEVEPARSHTDIRPMHGLALLRPALRMWREGTVLNKLLVAGAGWFRGFSFHFGLGGRLGVSGLRHGRR